MPAAPPLQLAELDRAIRRADPSAHLVPARLLRRVIRRECGLLDIALHVPHEKCHRIKTDALLRIATREELGLGTGDLPASLILLEAPEEEELAQTPRDNVLLHYWRLLFHARIHVVLEDRWARGELTLRGLNERIEEIGQREFHEACAVLDIERFLLPPADQRSKYIEFVAVYLDLWKFANTLIPSYFPSIRDGKALAASLSRDLGAEEIFFRTRLSGAPDPSPPTETTSEEPVAYFRKLVREADEAAGRGNVVRAAILRTRAARVAPAYLEAPTQQSANRVVFELVDRLRAFLEFDDAAVARWRDMLLELLDKSDQGFWPEEARLIYDLERASVEWERPLFRVSVLRWLLGKGLRESLPYQRELLVVKHLQKAYDRLPAVRLSVEDRDELKRLLDTGLDRVKEQLRGRLRPLLESAFRESGLVATGLVEEESRSTLVEGLLDRIAERSFLSFADVRDAISGNQVKLGDLRGIRELIRGDTVLEVDRRLKASLVGIYGPGEIYRRWLQVVSSVLFGTRRGRTLLRWFLLPTAGAVALCAASEHIVGWPLSFFSDAEFRLTTPVPLGVAAVLLLLLINHAGIREKTLRGVRFVRRGVRSVLVEIPVAVGRLPQVRRLVRQDWFITLVRSVLRPALLTILIVYLFRAFERPIEDRLMLLFIYLSSALVLNSSYWRAVEEGIEDSVLRVWRFLRSDFFPGIYRMLMHFFRRLSETVEKMVYSVDEWLRYRAGEGRFTLMLKSFLAPIWAPINYTLRFAFDTVIEPRINPIKYVSAVMIVDKLTIPLTPTGLKYFLNLFEPLGAFWANTLAWFFLYAIPAFIGFFIWELKENWRLYRANRPAALRVQPMKLHGKTLPQLLKGGGPTSNLPALYAKLRRAERRAHRTGIWAESRHHRAALESVKDVIERFIERELLHPLTLSRTWGRIPIRLTGVLLGLARVRIELESDLYSGRPIVIVFEADSGCLVATVTDPGFLGDLSKVEVEVFETALVGLYKKAGVEFVQEQVESYLHEFQALSLAFSFAHDGLHVWPAGELSAAAVYDLQRQGPIKPEPMFGNTPVALPTLESRRILFSDFKIAWDEYVRAWEEEREGKLPALSARLPVLIDERRLVRKAPPAAANGNGVQGQVPAGVGAEAPRVEVEKPIG